MPRHTLFHSNKLSQPLEKTLWEAADILRKNIDAAEYKHVVLGLIFLRYISDTFETLYQVFKQDGQDPENPVGYADRNVFFVPPDARWQHLSMASKRPNFGLVLDEAMDTIESLNPSLKGVLSRVYSRDNLDPASLVGLMELIGNISMDNARNRSADVLGLVFEYFLGQFALGEGKKGGQFYTPRTIVELLVEMLEPYQGKVFDPCCGSGGMFVQSEKFVSEHQGQSNNITIYGQESNQTTWRLAKMNLAIRGLDSSHVVWNSEGSFLNDAHPSLKADYVIANPPFNDSDWSGGALRRDGRWHYGIPPVQNANYAWLQHFIYHLSPTGQAGVVLSRGAQTSNTGNEGDIRRRMIEDGNLVDCIVNLPAKLFLNTQIPASLWFLRKDRQNGLYRDRSQEILFIDASDQGDLINRRTRILTKIDIDLISGTYHNWRNHGGNYQDIKAFCCSAHLDRVRDLDHSLSPARYVDHNEQIVDVDYKAQFKTLKDEFESQLADENRLNHELLDQLKKIQI